MKKLLIALTAAAALAGCASSSPDLVSRDQVSRTQGVYTAVVESVRTVTVDGSQSGVGAVAGAVVGGVAGASVGGHREGIIVGTVGAVLGAVAGNALERAGTKETAIELMLRMPDGNRLAFVQAKGSEQFRPGDRVELIGPPGKQRAVLSYR